jgi:hypothetical protein
MLIESVKEPYTFKPRFEPDQEVQMKFYVPSDYKIDKTIMTDHTLEEFVGLHPTLVKIQKIIFLGETVKPMIIVLCHGVKL